MARFTFLQVKILAIKTVILNFLCVLNLGCLEVGERGHEMFTFSLAADGGELGLYLYRLDREEGTSKEEIKVEQTGMLGLRMRSAANVANNSCATTSVCFKIPESISSKLLVVSKHNKFISFLSKIRKAYHYPIYCRLSTPASTSSGSLLSNASFTSC